MTGDWPRDQIDHIDGNRDNNCWSNLREASNAENSKNRPTAKGYTYNAKRKMYAAQIMRGGKGYHLGWFKTADEARQAYLGARNNDEQLARGVQR
jgi:uracil phosphoribosyltransferase